MRHLIQIVGPRDSGKTKLIETFSTQVIHVDLNSTFNGYLDAPGRPTYLIQEAITERGRRKLEAWVTGDTILIEQMCKEPRFILNSGLWVYEGHKPIDFHPSLIWRVDAC